MPQGKNLGKKSPKKKSVCTSSKDESESESEITTQATTPTAREVSRATKPKKIPESKEKQSKGMQSEEGNGKEGSDTDLSDTGVKNKENAVSDENFVKEKHCNHSYLKEFIMEEIGSFCDEGQKFFGEKCMKCGLEYGESVRPTARKPLYYCPNFKEKCNALICFSCYCTAICEDNDTGKTRRCRHTSTKK